jgi:translation initiation factor IF-1
MAKRSKPGRRGRKNIQITDGVTGIITEALPDTLFCVRLDSGEEMKAYLAGKMRLYRIRVLVGDRVIVELEPYGGKGRIVKRL